ncbi:MAG TPA: hypothetical protein VH500_12470 [Nitrososphaeraceae archaeon]
MAGPISSLSSYQIQARGPEQQSEQQQSEQQQSEQQCQSDEHFDEAKRRCIPNTDEQHNMGEQNNAHDTTSIRDDTRKVHTNISSGSSSVDQLSENNTIPQGRDTASHRSQNLELSHSTSEESMAEDSLNTNKVNLTLSQSVGNTSLAAPATTYNTPRLQSSSSAGLTCPPDTHVNTNSGQCLDPTGKPVGHVTDGNNTSNISTPHQSNSADNRTSLAAKPMIPRLSTSNQTNPNLCYGITCSTGKGSNSLTTKTPRLEPTHAPPPVAGRPGPTVVAPPPLIYLGDGWSCIIKENPQCFKQFPPPERKPWPSNTPIHVWDPVLKRNDQWYCTLNISGPPTCIKHIERGGAIIGTFKPGNPTQAGPTFSKPPALSPDTQRRIDRYKTEICSPGNPNNNPSARCPPAQYCKYGAIKWSIFRSCEEIYPEYYPEAHKGTSTGQSQAKNDVGAFIDECAREYVSTGYAASYDEGVMYCSRFQLPTPSDNPSSTDGIAGEGNTGAGACNPNTDPRCYGPQTCTQPNDPACINRGYPSNTLPPNNPLPSRNSGGNSIPPKPCNPWADPNCPFSDEYINELAQSYKNVGPIQNPSSTHSDVGFFDLLKCGFSPNRCNVPIKDLQEYADWLTEQHRGLTDWALFVKDVYEMIKEGGPGPNELPPELEQFINFMKEKTHGNPCDPAIRTLFPTTPNECIQ